MTRYGHYGNPNETCPDLTMKERALRTTVAGIWVNVAKTRTGAAITPGLTKNERDALDASAARAQHAARIYRDIVLLQSTTGRVKLARRLTTEALEGAR